MNAVTKGRGGASRSGREGPKHHQVGKDYAHAAHHALVAHGHSFPALAHQLPTAERSRVVRKTGRLGLVAKT